MDDITTRTARTRYPHFPREVAAHVTLRAAATALVAPGTGALAPGAGVAVTTACAALATRVGLLAFVAAPASSPAGARPPEPLPQGFGALPERMLGRGDPPSRERLVVAGERCVEAWRRWAADPHPAEYRVGVAGALSLAAWTSWAVGSAARARTRASYALDVDPTDPLATLVDRWCRGCVGPTWWSVA